MTKERLDAEAPKVYPEISLDDEWQRQAQKYIELGFHTERNLSAEDYIASLPKFEAQPKAFAGRFDIPVLVETRITPQRQSELAGLPYHLEGYDVKDWEGDPKDYRTPDAPYATWIRGKRKFDDIRNTLETDERGGTEYDGVALWISKPGLYVSLPGSSVESDRVPFIDVWGVRSRPYYYFVHSARSEFVFVSCGRVES